MTLGCRPQDPLLVLQGPLEGETTAGDLRYVTYSKNVQHMLFSIFPVAASIVVVWFDWVLVL